MTSVARNARVLERCAGLALAGLHREYPSKIAHVMHGDRDARPPRDLTPIFYGCFDWHSSVHSHWSLVRCCRTVADAAFVAPARAALERGLTEQGVAGEIRYLEAPGRASFERPYGLAWLLQLCAELHEWEDAAARAWSRRLEPLESLAARRLGEWLPRLSHPVRTGEHGQTAFAMGLALDWALVRGDDTVAALVTRRALDFHATDAGRSLRFEPSGQDFLSPALAEADLMRRVLEPPDFASWLGRFLPELGEDALERRLAPVAVTDPTDGKLAHLDGLNLSRAWMLEGIAAGLPGHDERRPYLAALADRHADAGIASLAGEHYEGTHWLGSFAVYLVTRRGLRGVGP